MNCFLVFVFSTYFILIIYLAVGFAKQKKIQASQTTHQIKFSILIPFRNEVENLPKLINSIEALEYSPQLFEIIFIDDDSTDGSHELIKTYVKEHTNWSLIRNDRKTASPKKDAIFTALQKTTFDWVITTDADCIIQKKWLTTLNHFIKEYNPNMVVSPVNYRVKNTFLEQFQLFDFMSLQAATIGGFGNAHPFLCNGANLAYRKNVFKIVDGFNGNTSIASGDDIFLFEKFLQYNKNAVQYLKSKEALVTTFPMDSWKKLIQQRIRWASKTGNISLATTKVIGLIIFITNFCLVLDLCFFGNILQKTTFLVLKISIDLLLLIPALNFFSKPQKSWQYYILSSVLYPFFSVAIVILSIFTKYTWKGRTFKT